MKTDSIDIQDKLTTKEKRDLYIQIRLELIPYIGSSLSTLYFGNKQELRFKRIEEFYRQVSEDIKKIKGEVNISGFDQQKLSELIETINESIEKEIVDEKITYFKNCFVKTIQESEFKYERRKFFIRCLTDIEEKEISTLKEFKKYSGNQSLMVKKEGISNIERFESIACFEKLKSFGLVSSHLGGTIQPSIDWSEITHYKLTELGHEFIEFCLSDKQNHEHQQ